jgi:hypothetical protein
MANSLNDGLNTPDQFDTGAIQSAEIGSGAILSANISGAQVLSSHIASGNVLSAQISGAQVLKSHIASGNVLIAHISGGQVSGNVVSAEYPVCYTGSPGIGNTAIQFGTGTIGAGSSVWVAFGTPFAAAPQVFLTNTKTVSKVVNVVAGSTNAGSFFAEGEAASDTFSWLACGSGRI